MTTAEYKPSDHILDDFLAAHGIGRAIDYAAFSGVLADLRVAFAEELGPDMRADALSEAIEVLDRRAADLGAASTYKSGLEYGGTLLYRMIPSDQHKRLTAQANS